MLKGLWKSVRSMAGVTSHGLEPIIVTIRGYCSHPTGVPVTASGHLKVTFGEGPDARQPLLLWSDTVQCGARCRVNSNDSGSFLTETRIVIIVGIVNWLYNRSKL